MKQLFLSQEAESPMAVNLTASPRLMVKRRVQHPCTRAEMWNRLIEIRGENTSRAFADADLVRPYLLKSKAPFLTA
jgi:hypothetical protein